VPGEHARVDLGLEKPNAQIPETGNCQKLQDRLQRPIEEWVIATRWHGFSLTWAVDELRIENWLAVLRTKSVRCPNLLAILTLLPLAVKSGADGTQ
jgi:hypothetical protein